MINTFMAQIREKIMSAIIRLTQSLTCMFYIAAGKLQLNNPILMIIEMEKFNNWPNLDDTDSNRIFKCCYAFH